MEFTCEKKQLQEAVLSVERIVAARSTLPIIGYILFEADKSGLKISANNLEMGIELGVKALVNKEGAILVPAKTLGGIVAKLPDKKIEFKLSEKGMLKVNYGNSYFNVHTLPPDEFPALPKVKGGKSISVGKDTMVSMIEKTIFSVSSSEDKYVLTGVLFEVGKSAQAGDNSNIRMVATDGYRLAKMGERMKGKEEMKGGVIIPARSLQELGKILGVGSGEGEVEINFSNEQISFAYNQAYIISRLIQGQFPDYKQVIPKKGATKILMKRKEFLESAERAMVIATGSANVVKFEIKDSLIHLLASTPDVGMVDEVMEGKIEGAEKLQIAFNIRLITDVLKVMKGENVILELTESLGPGMIRQEGEENYLYIVMPIRTQEIV